MNSAEVQIRNVHVSYLDDVKANCVDFDASSLETCEIRYSLIEYDGISNTQDFYKAQEFRGDSSADWVLLAQIKVEHSAFVKVLHKGEYNSKYRTFAKLVYKNSEILFKICDYEIENCAIQAATIEALADLNAKDTQIASKLAQIMQTLHPFFSGVKSAVETYVQGKFA